jgi:hypothetical protein
MATLTKSSNGTTSPKDLKIGLFMPCYSRVRLDQTAYGCFMMGPSATGDIEATLVHGAQGSRSLNLFFLSRLSL